MQHYKKALLVVSFGTTFPNAIEAIENIERAFQNTFPDYDFFRVFTSGMIIRKLKRTKGIEIMDIKKALDHLYKEGYAEVLCQTCGCSVSKIISEICSGRSPFDL